MDELKAMELTSNIKVKKPKPDPVKILKRVMTEITIYVPLLFFAFITLYPFYYIIVMSTRTPHQMLMHSDMAHTVGFARDAIDNLKGAYAGIMWQVPFWKNVWNSIYIAGMSTILTLFCSSLGGYSFAVYNFKGKEALFNIMLITLMIPTVVSVIPFFALMKTLNWFNKARALYLPSIASAYGVFLMRKYIESSVPRDLLDAARIDGCTEFMIYRKVVLPLVRPGLGALGIITFITSWSSYLLPMLFMTDTGAWTIPLVINRLWNPASTALAVVITVVPLSIVFLSLSKWIISGITAGSVKDF